MASISTSPAIGTIKETLKESLLGSEEPQQLSAQTKATFLKHAHKDEASGELLMNEKEFVDAIAPVNEDYVSRYVACSSQCAVG